MAEIITLYRGEFTNSRTNQFRQVETATRKLLDRGLSKKWINYEKTINHEKAHIVGHEPGRSGRIISQVLVNKYNSVVGWYIEHEINPDEKLSMSGKEIIKGSLSPAFINKRKTSFLSIYDVANALYGCVVVARDLLRGKKVG